MPKLSINVVSNGKENPLRSCDAGKRIALLETEGSASQGHDPCFHQRAAVRVNTLDKTRLESDEIAP